MASELDQFLVALDTKIAALQALRSSYVAAVSVGAFGQPGDATNIPAAPGAPSAGAPMDLPRGALVGKSVPAAIRLYLSAVRQKTPSRQIAAVLRDGGVESLAANFETTVASALHRMKENGEVLRFDEGWALAEFYPDSFKNRMAKDAKPSKKRAKKPATQKAAPVLHPPTAAGPTAVPSIDTRVLAFLKTQAGAGVTLLQVSSALGEPKLSLIRLAFARLAYHGKAVKDAEGLYRAA